MRRFAFHWSRLGGEGGAVAALLLLGACAAYQPPPAGPVAQVAGQGDVMTATCHSVDQEAKTVSVITGVGLALTLYTFKVGDATTITKGGEPRALADLDPGEVLRIVFERTAGDPYAKRIEAFSVERGGR